MPVFVSARSACGVMVVSWVSDSLPGVGSLVAEVTEAVLVSPPLAPPSTVAPTVMT